jgi:HpcH/HpaI aldolase/citrate lyase family
MKATLLSSPSSQVLQRYLWRSLFTNGQRKPFLEKFDDVPRRSYLYGKQVYFKIPSSHSHNQTVPASSGKMLQKSLTIDADTIIYDLEDSVAVSHKDQARNSLMKFLNSEIDNLPPSSKLAVRINAMNTIYFEEDVHTLLKVATTRQLSTIVIPKVINQMPMTYLFEKLGLLRPWNVIASIESARSLWHLNNICKFDNPTIRLSAILVSFDQTS